MNFHGSDDPANKSTETTAPSSEPMRSPASSQKGSSSGKAPSSSRKAAPASSEKPAPSASRKRSASIRRAKAAGSSEAVRAFGDEVRRRRIALNITQKMLAQQAGLSTTHLGNIERGRRKRGLSLEAAFRIAKGMGTDVPDLVGGYMGLSGEGLEAARLILAIPPESRLPLLDLVRSLASGR